ncbi:MAG: DciA family protein [Patescibacteria group bacterium]
MDSLSSLLGKKFHNVKIQKQAEAGLVVEFANNFFRELWGAQSLNKIKAVSYKEGILKVKVSGSLMNQELRFKTNRIKDAVNKEFALNVKQIKATPTFVESFEEIC